MSVTFIFSSQLFTGYRHTYPYEMCKDLNHEDIITDMKSELAFSLLQLQLSNLVDELRNTHFHVNGEVKPGETVYICDCKHH